MACPARQAPCTGFLVPAGCGPSALSRSVPEFGFVAVTGTGEPGGAEFTEAVQAPTAEAASKMELPGLASLQYIRWAEGRCAQLLHIGPRRVPRFAAAGNGGSP